MTPWLIKCSICPNYATCRGTEYCALTQQRLAKVSEEQIADLQKLQKRISH